MSTLIELTESEAAIWQRMPDDAREVTLSLLGVQLRWWAKMNPEDTADTLPPSEAVEPPSAVEHRKPYEPPTLNEPTEAELIADIQSGKYGIRPLRALELGEINESNVRRRIATILNPGASEAVDPTHDPLPTAGE